MIKPGHPTLMFAAYDKTLDLYAVPMLCRTEARMLRNAQLPHLTMADRHRLFPVVPVAVTIAPAPDPECHATQAALFEENHHAEN